MNKQTMLNQKCKCLFRSRSKGAAPVVSPYEIFMEEFTTTYTYCAIDLMGETLRNCETRAGQKRRQV